MNLEEILVGEVLPMTVYLYLDFRFIAYRGADDVLDRHAYERLELRGIKNLFIAEKDRQAFTNWSQKRKEEVKAIAAANVAVEASGPVPGQNKNLHKAREDLHRKTMDIFHSQHPDKAVQHCMTASRKLVNEFMKSPFATKTLSQLQTYSQGTVDHSVNVSVLSVYLALQMGYSHAVILQHVGMGGLLHDIGKTKIHFRQGESDKEIAQKMRDHPTLGGKVLDSMKVPSEVKMIVVQHHECNDGTGFPKKIRGAQMYDLAKIVQIANVFDELVGDGQGPLAERQRSAIQQMDKVLYKKFDPQKLEKALKILRLGV